MFDHTVELDVKPSSQGRQHRHVTISKEGVAARKLREVVIMVPIEGGHLDRVKRSKVKTMETAKQLKTTYE